MLYRLFLALLWLSFAVVAATSSAVAQNQQVGDTEIVPLAAQAESSLEVISLLEEEIALLEADVEDLTAKRDAERVALERARQEANTLQAQIEDLHLAEEAATVTLTDLQNQQERLKAEIEDASTTIPDPDGLEAENADKATLKVERNALEMEINELQRARQLIQKVDDLRNAAEAAQAERGDENSRSEQAAFADEQAASIAVLEALDKEREIADDLLTGANALVTAAKKEVKELSDTVEARRADLAAVSAEGAAARETLEGLQAEETEVAYRLEQRRSDLTALELELEETSTRLIESSTAIETAKTTLDDLTAQRDATQIELAEASSALERTFAERADAEAKRVALTGELARLGEAITEAQATVAHTDEALFEAEARLATVRIESEQERLRLDDMRKEWTELEQQIQSRRVEILTLEETVEAIKAEHQSALIDLRAVVPDASQALTEASKEAVALGNETGSAPQIAPSSGRVATAKADGRDLETLPIPFDAEGEKLNQNLVVPVQEMAGAKEQTTSPEAGPNVVPDAAPADTPVPAPASPSVQRTAGLVAQALNSAPGLPSRGSAAFRQLTDLLNAGACPTDALRETFGTINRQTLVALVRVLGTCGG